MTSKPCQNRCGLEVFTRNRFRQKSKSWWKKRALQYGLKSPFWIKQCKFRAKIVTVFKSMWFRRLQGRWNRIVLKTLYFWHLAYGLDRCRVTASKTMRLQMKPRSCKRYLSLGVYNISRTYGVADHSHPVCQRQKRGTVVIHMGWVPSINKRTEKMIMMLFIKTNCRKLIVKWFNWLLSALLSAQTRNFLWNKNRRLVPGLLLHLHALVFVGTCLLFPKVIQILSTLRVFWCAFLCLIDCLCLAVRVRLGNFFRLIN